MKNAVLQEAICIHLFHAEAALYVPGYEMEICSTELKAQEKGTISYSDRMWRELI